MKPRLFHFTVKGTMDVMGRDFDYALGEVMERLDEIGMNAHVEDVQGEEIQNEDDWREER